MSLLAIAAGIVKPAPWPDPTAGPLVWAGDWVASSPAPCVFKPAETGGTDAAAEAFGVTRAGMFDEAAA